MTQIPQLFVVGTRAVSFAVTFRESLSRGDRSRFLRSMRRAVGRMGYPMSASRGMCLVLAPVGDSVRRCRDEVLVWLANQSEVSRIVIDSPRDVYELVEGGLNFVDEDGQLIRSYEAELSDFVCCMAMGAIAHAGAMARGNAAFEPWRLAGSAAAVALGCFNRRRAEDTRHSGSEES